MKLVDDARRHIARNPLREYLRKQWMETDLDGNDLLSLDEIKKLLKKINVDAPARHVEDQFRV